MGYHGIIFQLVQVTTCGVKVYAGKAENMNLPCNLPFVGSKLSCRTAGGGWLGLDVG